MQIYAGLGVVVLIIAFIAYSATKTEKTDPELMMTLSDVVKDPMENAEEDKEKYYKEIDKNGPYPTKDSCCGTLSMDSLLKLRSVINKHAYAKFVPRKTELMEERLGYFQQQNMQKYVECIQQSAQAYEQIMKEATLDALKFLDISEKNYEASFLEARS